MYSIVLIIPYFGHFRKDNAFWLKSVEKNPTVNFLILTDQTLPIVPPNVKVVHMSFKDCVNLLQNKLDCDISALHPYKLCDLKPAYGYLFQEYIKGYDFWGHCDTDLIFGNIRHFITDDILKNKDRILTRGHFTLYRNVPSVNETFKKASPSYKIVFPSELVFHYDEHPGTGKYWFENRSSRLYDEIIFDDLNWHQYLFVDVHKYSTLDKNRKYFIYSYEDGRLFRCFWEKDHVGREEIMYVHFQKRNVEKSTTPADYFTIIPNRYIPYVKNLNYDFLKRNVRNNYLYILFHFISVKWGSLKRKKQLWKKKFLCSK